MSKRLSGSLLGLALAAGLTACGQTSGEAHDHGGERAAFSSDSETCSTNESPPALGLMTSLPLVWSLDASFEDIANGKAERPWQFVLMSQCYTVVPLDTLSPIAGLSSDDPETDPLAGLERLAVIQPRGLSPADNVALDDWVRAGGQLLLVLDPMLTGHYEMALGDPRRPTDTALIPPVVKRWGMELRFIIYVDGYGGPRVVPYKSGSLTLDDHGLIAIDEAFAGACVLDAQDSLASCKVGRGTVTFLADAAMFEHPEFAGNNGSELLVLMHASFD